MTTPIRLKIITRSLLKYLLVIAVIAGLVLPAATPASAATCTLYHTVKRGENLYRIGLKYGVSWRNLASWNNLANPRVIFSGQKLCVSTSVQPSSTPSSAYPSFIITAVVKDQSVTVKTSNLPANDKFNVFMGRMGTRAVNGVKSDRVASGAGGTLTFTFAIPDALKGLRQIAIRMESPTSGYFSYNWFYNNSSGTGTGGVPAPQTGYTGIPTFKIVSVVRNQTVTVKTTNMPANDTFNVYMGYMGTRGVNGIKVDQVSSGAGGTLTLTFTIPGGLKGLKQIAVRMQSPTSGYYSYNWFYNNTYP